MNTRRLLPLLLLSSLLIDCKNADSTDPVTPQQGGYSTGWLGTDVPSNVPKFLSTFGTTKTGTLPASVDLTAYMPPVGNQGTVGTCVCWATGYYARSITEAVTKNLSKQEMANPATQTSPKDLWEAIAKAEKMANCEGTNATYALSVLQSRGSATLDVAPYGALNCDGAPSSAAAADARNHKIRYFRTVDRSITAIKRQLANKIPVIFAAIVGDPFQTYRGGVINYSVQSGKVGGHAMTVVGYDDARSAFKIVNSWGTGWGEQGFGWVEYNTFVNTFIRNENLYIIGGGDESIGSKLHPDSGPDLAPWVFSDAANATTSAPSQRLLDFNIYNIGTVPVRATANWDFYYIYYNATNANEYGIIFADKFATSGAVKTYTCPNGNCTFNYDIPAGSNFSEEVFGRASLKRTYTLPSTLNGSYYLILYADATGALTESNKQNNLFYTSGQNPLVFRNGVAARTSAETTPFSFRNQLGLSQVTLKKNVFNTAVGPAQPNAYTPDEVIGFLTEKRNSGELARKIQAYKSANPYQQN
jgi:hypothetical protein